MLGRSNRSSPDTSHPIMYERPPRSYWLRDSLRILGLLTAFEISKWILFGPPGGAFGWGARVAEAEAGGSNGDASSRGANGALDGIAAGIEALRCELEAALQGLSEQIAQDAAKLERALGDKADDYADTLHRVRRETETVAMELAGLRARSESLTRLEKAIQRNPAEMHRAMILPTVQLRGNGTVGSGVIVYSEPQPEDEPGCATFVLTAYHVVAEVLGDRWERGTIDEVHVLRPDDPEKTRIFSARLVLFDRRRDLALLLLNTSEKFEQVATWRPRSALREIGVFRQAYAVGCPLGNRPLPTLGEISSKAKAVGDQTFWMLNAPIYFGNSGGGVFLADTYELIGISSMIYTYGKTNPVVVPHLGLFVPLETVYDWLDSQGCGFLPAKKPIPAEKRGSLIAPSGRRGN